ncbi:MAG: hypothetical protein HQM00_12840, partial [Magnetococcales bacterium]|nr:hypothetical protein [Magnetococcales bacterium]
MSAEAFSPEWQERYSRQILLPEIGGDGQRRLDRAAVGIVGGDEATLPALLYLAAAGVGFLRVTDPHAERLEQARAWAAANNPTVTIVTAPRLDPDHPEAWLKGLELVIDLHQQWPWLDPLCRSRQIPLLTTWITPDGRGWVAGSRGGTHPAPACLTCHPPPWPPIPPEQMGTPWFSLWRGVAATLLATETLKHLLAIGDP